MAYNEEGMAEYCGPVPLNGDSPNRDYKVLFAIARLKGKRKNVG